MSDITLTCAGHDVIEAEIHVPRVGPWYADLDFGDEALEAAGSATLMVGDVALVGTFVQDRSGTFGLQRKARLVAGKASWGATLKAKAYRNDAQVKASLVAGDAARECGETLGDFAPAADRLGIAWAREAGPASAQLEAAIGNVQWWVGYDGVTRVGQHPIVDAAGDAFRVLHYDPRLRAATLDVDALNAINVGSRLTSDAFEAPLEVRTLILTVKPSGIRLIAYAGDETGSRIVDALRAIVSRVSDSRLHGAYRYRVVGMNGEGLADLQAVRKAVGVPDLLRCPLWGASGVWPEFTPGTEVAVSFLDGDRGQPFIVAAIGSSGPGAQPKAIALGGRDLQLGRMGDLVQSGGAAAVVTLWPVATAGVGAPPNNAVVAGVPCFISFSPTPLVDRVTGADCAPLFGAIVTGAPKVATSA